MKTAKEYLFSKYPNVSSEWFDDNELMKEMIVMMEEYYKYASQSLPITEKEIENHFLIEEPRGYGCSYYKGLVNGAKWALSCQQPTASREKIIEILKPQLSIQSTKSAHQIATEILGLTEEEKE